MYNKSQLSRDLKAAREPKRLAKPKDIDYVSKMGYRDDSPFKDREYIDIDTPNKTVDMSNTGIDLIANGRFLPKYSGIHYFDTDKVREIPFAKFGGPPEKGEVEGYNEDSPWLGESYKDLGATFSKGNFNISAGNYFPTKVNQPTGIINPYVNVGYDFNKNKGFLKNSGLSFEATPGYTGVTFSKSFEDGGEYMDLTDEEIAQYRAGGYIVDETPYPKRNNPANAFQVTDPRSMAEGGELPTAQSGKTYRRTYDPLLDYQPQVSESTKPKTVAAIDKNVLKKEVVKKTEERKKVAQAVKKSPMLTDKQKTEILMSPEKLDENAYLAYQKAPDTVKESTPQSTTGRVWDIVTNPQAAFEYAVRTGDVSNMPHNYNAMLMAGIDPSAGQGSNLVGDALNTSYNLFDAGDKVVRNINEGNYGAAALEALRFFPGSRLSTGLGKQTSKYLTQGPLRNAYNYNPFAGKLGEYNRVVGQDAIDDIVESGLVRVNENAGVANDLGPFGIVNRTTPYPSFGKAKPQQVYADQVINQGKTPYIISTDRPMMPSTLGRHGKGKTQFPVDEAGKYMTGFPANEAKVFEFGDPHWLKGYKEVPVELPGSPNTFTRSGLGGMDMSRYEIKNPDYFHQLIKTYDNKALPAANRKFYKDLVEAVKKQNGLATERQYLELQRLKTGNFNFGKKAYEEGGSYVDNQMVHFQNGGNTDPGNNALELHMFYDKTKVKEDGGSTQYLTQKEIDDLRAQGYHVIED